MEKSTVVCRWFDNVKTSDNVFTARALIPVPPGFNFRQTVYSHGWCMLPPFSYDEDTGALQRILSLSSGKVIECVLSPDGRAIRVSMRSMRPLSREDRRDMNTQLRSCLRLDEDLSPFWREARRHSRYRWIARAGAGRLLRAPSVFEDVMKMICTTNCTWALTTVIVSNLVESFGEPFNAGHHTFPTAGAIAGSTERYLRTKIKAGYRAPYLLELSERVASGTLALEEWRNSPLDTPSLYREICSIKGVGPYATQNLLRLLGRYEHLGLDSWVRAQHAKLHHGGRTVKDSAIERRYAPLGSWRGLFFWLEMTRHWHENSHQHSSR